MLFLSQMSSFIKEVTVHYSLSQSKRGQGKNRDSKLVQLQVLENRNIQE